MGGLPSEWAEERVQDLLLHFGKLQAFNLVKDRNTGNSKVRRGVDERSCAWRRRRVARRPCPNLLNPCRTRISPPY